MDPKNTTALRSVYAIRCKETGRIYIGSSVNPVERARQHFYELKNGYKGNCKKKSSAPAKQWQQDYNEYGKDAFELYIMETNLPLEKSFEREKYYIERYQSRNPDYGYNVNYGCEKKKNPFVTTINGLPPIINEIAGADDE